MCTDIENVRNFKLTDKDCAYLYTPLYIYTKNLKY